MRWFLIIALVTILFTDLTIAWRTSYYEVNSTAKYYTEENSQERTIEGPFVVGANNAFHLLLEFSESNDKAITALSTLVIAAFTVILAWATVGLWRKADTQSKDMKESLRIASNSARAAQTSAKAAERTIKTIERMAQHELRAYVGVKKAFIRLTSIATRSKKILGKVTITNVGKTIAKNVRLAIHVDFFDDLNGPFPVTYRPGETYIHPNIDWNVQQETEIEVGDALRARLMDKTKHVVMWGEVSYFDGFYGDFRVSKFRFTQGMFLTADNLTGWDVHACEEGNEAT